MRGPRRASLKLSNWQTGSVHHRTASNSTASNNKEQLIVWCSSVVAAATATLPVINNNNNNNNNNNYYSITNKQHQKGTSTLCKHPILASSTVALGWCLVVWVHQCYCWTVLVDGSGVISTVSVFGCFWSIWLIWLVWFGSCVMVDPVRILLVVPTVLGFSSKRKTQYGEDH